MSTSFNKTFSPDYTKGFDLLWYVCKLTHTVRNYIMHRLPTLTNIFKNLHILFVNSVIVMVISKGKQFYPIHVRKRMNRCMNRLYLAFGISYVAPNEK